jgi:DNA mismatch repair protein MutL
MSDIIRLLPDHIANQIAAGEVIQRPASVIKELVENAIDAKATSIDVYIKHAGRTLIQVIDNGGGMSETDARMAFERHATSKVSNIEDLFALQTKGFRGEALASIAAIAHVELKTRKPENELGVSLLIEGSKLIEQTQVTCKPGSSFAIKNLFFNVPARRNFLKSDAIEFKHIEEEFVRVAMAHPELSFSLHHNEAVCYVLPEGNLRKRIVDIFGKSMNDKLVPVEETTGIVKISGFIGKPEAAKKTRGEQYFFVNNRFFKDFYFNHAITQAFDNLLVPKTFPSYFLFFEVNPSSIDVNVHPTKTEIKFEEDKEIYAILKSSIRQALGKYNIAPSLDFEQETGFTLPYEMIDKPVVEPKITLNPGYNPFNTSSTPTTKSVSSGMTNAIKSSGFRGTIYTSKDWGNFYDIEEIKDSKDEFPTLDLEIEEVKKEFITKGHLMLFPSKRGFLVIHTTRAQERILYDEIMQTFVIKALNSQQLLFPLLFECSSSVKILWEENKTTLERMGYSWNLLDEGIEITGAPAELSEDAILYTIQVITEKLCLETIDKGEIAHEIAVGISTANASKKVSWNKETANLLFDNLFECTEHQFTPQGKRILHTLTTEEILKNF